MTARFVAALAVILVCATASLGPQSRSGDRAQGASAQDAPDTLRGRYSPEPPLDAADPNRAGIVVRSGDGEIRKMCIAFESDEISGFDLLERTHLDLVVDRGAIGNAVCKIEGDGCSSGDCFCDYPTFWGYWTRDEGDRSWAFSDVGATDRKVRDGSLDAWSWGRDGKPAPPKLSFDDVCSAAGETTRAEATPAAAPDRNYIAFAALAVVIALGAGLAYIVRRR